jgi:hypothetical protein
MYTTHVLDLHRDPSITMFSEDDPTSLKIRGATLNTITLPHATTHECVYGHHGKSFQQAYEKVYGNRMMHADEPRGHVLTTVSVSVGGGVGGGVANNNTLRFIEIVTGSTTPTPGTSTSTSTNTNTNTNTNTKSSVYMYEESCLQKSVFSLTKCLKVMFENARSSVNSIVPWREDKLVKIVLGVASSTDTTHVIMHDDHDQVQVGRYWGCVKKTATQQPRATVAPKKRALANDAKANDARAHDKKQKTAPVVSKPAKSAKQTTSATSATSVFSSLTPTSGLTARTLIKTARDREQSGKLESAVKHYRAANSKFLPNYPKLEDKIKRLETRLDESNAIKSLLGPTPGKPTTNNSKVDDDDDAFRGIMGATPRRVVKDSMVDGDDNNEDDDDVIVPKRLASTPTLGTPMRVMKSQQEEVDDVEMSDIVVGQNIIGTPLKGTPGRVLKSEQIDEEEEEEEVKNVAKLASTPLKGTPARVLKSEQVDDEESPEAAPAPAAKLASTPLKGTPARVLKSEQVDEEEEEAPVAPTAVVTTKLASTPLKGAPARAPQSEQVDDEDMEDVAEKPHANALTATKLPGTPSRVLAVNTENDESSPADAAASNTPTRRKSLLASTPLRGTPARVTKMENMLSYADTLMNPEEDFAKPPTPPPAAARTPLARTPLGAKKATATPAPAPALATATKQKWDIVKTLNSGDIEQLMELAGIGKKRADMIIKEREHCEFQSASELIRVGLTGKAIMKLTSSQFGGTVGADENVAPAANVVVEETTMESSKSPATRRSTRAAAEEAVEAVEAAKTPTRRSTRAR